jgi:hypothetical protein
VKAWGMPTFMAWLHLKLVPFLLWSE